MAPRLCNTSANRELNSATAFLYVSQALAAAEADMESDHADSSSSGSKELSVDSLSAVVFAADGKKQSSSEAKLGEKLLKKVQLKAGESVEGGAFDVTLLLGDPSATKGLSASLGTLLLPEGGLFIAGMGYKALGALSAARIADSKALVTSGKKTN
eukprot:gene10701-10858_t